MKVFRVKIARFTGKVIEFLAIILIITSIVQVMGFIFSMSIVSLTLLILKLEETDPEVLPRIYLAMRWLMVYMVGAFIGGLIWWVQRKIIDKRRKCH